MNWKKFYEEHDRRMAEIEADRLKHQAEMDRENRRTENVIRFVENGGRHDGHAPISGTASAKTPDRPPTREEYLEQCRQSRKDAEAAGYIVRGNV